MKLVCVVALSVLFAVIAAGQASAAPTPYVAAHAWAIKTDGTIVCRGDNDYGQFDSIPAGSTPPSSQGATTRV